jgi:hypothetical protein
VTAEEGGIRSFGEHECASIAWAFAKHGHPHKRLWRALRCSVAAEATLFTGQGLANVAWALSVVSNPASDGRGDDVDGNEHARAATTDTPDRNDRDEALSAVKAAAASVAGTGRLSVHHVIAVWQSVAASDACDPVFSTSMASAVAVAAADAQGGLTAHDSATALVAIVKEGGGSARHARLARLLERRAAESAEELSPSSMAALLWACARADTRPQQVLLDRLADAATARAE